jgi:hypothetical protein
LDVADDGLGRIVGIHQEVDFRGDALIRACGAEGLAVKNVGAFLNVDFVYSGEGDREKQYGG